MAERRGDAAQVSLMNESFIAEWEQEIEAAGGSRTPQIWRQIMSEAGSRAVSLVCYVPVSWRKATFPQVEGPEGKQPRIPRWARHRQGRAVAL